MLPKKVPVLASFYSMLLMALIVITLILFTINPDLFLYISIKFGVQMKDTTLFYNAVVLVRMHSLAFMIKWIVKSYRFAM